MSERKETTRVTERRKSRRVYTYPLANISPAIPKSFELSPLRTDKLLMRTVQPTLLTTKKPRYRVKLLYCCPFPIPRQFKLFRKAREFERVGRRPRQRKAELLNFLPPDVAYFSNVSSLVLQQLLMIATQNHIYN
jgi:hypothetical protein